MRKYRKQLERPSIDLTLHVPNQDNLEDEQWVIDTGQVIFDLAKESNITVNEAYIDLFDSVITDYGKASGRVFGGTLLNFDLTGQTPGQVGAYFIRSLQSLGYEPPEPSRVL